MRNRPVNRDQPLSLTQIGDGLTRAMSSTDRPLEQNGGNARTIFSLTVNNLRDRCRMLQAGPADTERVVAAAEEQFDKGIKLCESPIECMALAALMNGDWWGFGSIPPKIHDAKRDVAYPTGDLIIIPQFAFARYRIDFAVVGKIGNHMTRIAAVECDGRDFHDPEKDRARDHYLKSWGIDTYRIKGSEINFDAVKAVLPAVYSFTDWKKEVVAERKPTV